MRQSRGEVRPDERPSLGPVRCGIAPIMGPDRAPINPYLWAGPEMPRPEILTGGLTGRERRECPEIAPGA